MKRFDVGQAIQTLANFGVIAGIIFLAVEVSQSNDELASQTRNTIYQMRADLQTDYINNVGGLAELYVKSRRGDPLTEVEQSRMGSRRAHVLRTLEYMFEEDREGTMESADWAAIVFRGDTGLFDVWNAEKSTRDPEFVRWFEEFVIPQIDP